VTPEEREALERLERRVALLEITVRKLIGLGSVPDPAALSPPASRRPAAPPQPTAAAVASAATPAPLASRRPAPPSDWEQWVGQRGLLVVGVLALLAATGFFLKYAFDRHWVPPLARSIAAVAAGIVLAVWGDRQIGRGMRRYGAAMIGGGGGLVFLGLWAAAGPYALIERRVGVLLLAATTVAVALLALRHEIEGLAMWAIVGAYLAPVLLPPPAPQPLALLGYLEVIGLGLALLAFMLTWRRAFDLALAGYILLAAVGATALLVLPLGLWFLASGALITLHVTYRRPWPEARVGFLLLIWLTFAAHLPLAATAQGAIWLGLGAPAAVAGVLWWQHVRRDPFGAAARGEPWAVGDALLGVANPFILCSLARAAGPALLDPVPGALPAALGALHLGVGWTRRRAGFYVLGVALLATAVAAQWPAWATVIGWSVLMVSTLAAARGAARPGASTAGLGLAPLILGWLFLFALDERSPVAPAFADTWALAWYAATAGLAVGARWWRAVEDAPGRAPLARGGEVLWALFGTALLVGGSIELHRFFGAMTALAGDLALSVYWLACAGVLVWLGFRLARKPIRVAGLGLAAFAGLKVVLYDLAALNALYRIASFFALALVTLAVAYAYNRRAKVSAA
jgi:uncharacterized membrane protein